MKHNIAAMAAALAIAASMTACSNSNTGSGNISKTDSTSEITTEDSTNAETEASSDIVPEEEPVVSDNFDEPVIEPRNLLDYHLDNQEMVEILKDNSKGVNALNSSLLTLMSASGEKQVMVSGFSAYSCLSSAAKYIDGNSKTQINNALGELNPEALDYFKTHMPIETGTMFLIDDSLVLNVKKSDDFVFEDLQSDNIVKLVNNFVSDKTHNLITNLIGEPFDAHCRAAVIDTIYFKGTWEHKFDKNATDRQMFYGLNGDAETDFMHSYHNYGVDIDNNIIELKYRNSDLVMDICYDTVGNSPENAFKSYVSKLDTLNDRLDYSYDVSLSMPKFETENKMDVTDAYKSLGMTDMFMCPDDFRALADDICISDVIQKTKIIVDEEGTEAAAVTMMEMKDAAAAIDEPKILEVNINKPFVYAIRDTNTGIILFSGYITDF